MVMEFIPVVATAEELPKAVEYATQNPEARWLVARRAVQFGMDDIVPVEWLDTLVAAFTGDRQKLAENGEALPDGSFPIPNTTYLHKAIQAFGRAKNKPLAKRHIIKRARALGAVSMLPESWGVTAAAEPLAASGAPEPEAVTPSDVAYALTHALSAYSSGETEMPETVAVIEDAMVAAAACEHDIDDTEKNLDDVVSAFLSTSRIDGDEAETLREAITAAGRHVRTEEGSKFFGQPIGAEIVPNVYLPVGRKSLDSLVKGDFFSSPDSEQGPSKGGKLRVVEDAYRAQGNTVVKAVDADGDEYELKFDRGNQQVQVYNSAPKGAKATLGEKTVHPTASSPWYEAADGKGYTQNPEQAARDASGKVKPAPAAVHKARTEPQVVEKTFGGHRVDLHGETIGNVDHQPSLGYLATSSPHEDSLGHHATKEEAVAAIVKHHEASASSTVQADYKAPSKAEVRKMSDADISKQRPVLEHSLRNDQLGRNERDQKIDAKNRMDDVMEERGYTIAHNDTLAKVYGVEKGVYFKRDDTNPAAAGRAGEHHKLEGSTSSTDTGTAGQTDQVHEPMPKHGETPPQAHQAASSDAATEKFVSPTFVSGKQRTLGEVNNDAKGQHPERFVPKKTMADGVTPVAGHHVLYKKTDESATIVETYQHAALIRLPDGSHKTASYSQLNELGAPLLSETTKAGNPTREQRPDLSPPGGAVTRSPEPAVSKDAVPESKPSMRTINQKIADGDSLTQAEGQLAESKGYHHEASTGTWFTPGQLTEEAKQNDRLEYGKTYPISRIPVGSIVDAGMGGRRQKVGTPVVNMPGSPHKPGDVVGRYFDAGGQWDYVSPETQFKFLMGPTGKGPHSIYERHGFDPTTGKPMNVSSYKAASPESSAPQLPSGTKVHVEPYGSRTRASVDVGGGTRVHGYGSTEAEARADLAKNFGGGVPFAPSKAVSTSSTEPDLSLKGLQARFGGPGISYGQLSDAELETIKTSGETDRMKVQAAKKLLDRKNRPAINPPKYLPGTRARNLDHVPDLPAGAPLSTPNIINPSENDLSKMSDDALAAARFAAGSAPKRAAAIAAEQARRTAGGGGSTDSKVSTYAADPSKVTAQTLADMSESDLNALYRQLYNKYTADPVANGGMRLAMGRVQAAIKQKSQGQAAAPPVSATLEQRALSRMLRPGAKTAGRAALLRKVTDAELQSNYKSVYNSYLHTQDDQSRWLSIVNVLEAELKRRGLPADAGNVRYTGQN